MLSGKIRTVAVSSVVIAPDRQRKELKGVEELAESIRQTGLMHPIVVTPDGVLVAGERRLRAHMHLGLTHILAHYTTDLGRPELELLELEENVKRKDLTWQERVDGVVRVHELKSASDPEWTQTATAAYLSIAASEVGHCLSVKQFMQQGDALILGADTFTTAKNIAARKRERQLEDVDASIDELLGAPFTLKKPVNPARDDARGTSQSAAAQPQQPPSLPIEMPKPDHPYVQADFREWAKLPYTGPKFNFLHCDFPYGINFDKHNGGATGTLGAYEDSPELYDQCLDALASIMETHVADSAHLLFWLSARHDIQQKTRKRLDEMGWAVNLVSLIWWRSDNAGILPDPSRGPRQVYELAFLASRGDRKVVQPVSNLVGHPKTKEIHASEKPRDMLRHFFRMFVDETTVMLDPTMGSGNSILVAEDMGARHVLGLEAMPEIFENAVRHRGKVKSIEG